MSLTRFAAAAAMIVLVAGTATAQETIPNPEFANWSKFKKGASVTLKSTSNFGKTSVETLITMTLVEVGSDKLVLDTTSVSKLNGMEIKSPVVKRDVPKTSTVPKIDPKVAPKVEKPKTEEGTETVKVSGVEVKAKWYKVTQDVMGTKTESKSWTSDEIPGGLVKMVSKTSGTVEGSLTMEVIEFKKP